MDDPEAGWSEADSEHFIDLGQIYIPFRQEIGEVILDLIPAERDEAFLAIDLGIGAGWLSAAILERFPQSRVLGLDGSPAMLRQAATMLHRFEGRFELRPFRLEDPFFLEALNERPRCVVSSLIIHHRDGPEKHALYRDLHAILETGGGLLIADIVAPAGERERRHMARAYDEVVKEQSLAYRGNLDAYQRFLNDQWNWYEHPDPMDKPSTIPEHLRWLEAAGFTGVNVFWERAGHAVYGGYKPA